MRRSIALQGIVAAAMLLMATTSSAQNDSGRNGNDKQLIRLLAKLSEDSAKLVKFKGMISQFEKGKKDAAEQAQQSADDNKRAADRLADDPQDKRLARKARGAAKTARNDSQKARVAANKLDDLNDDIKKLTRQLGKEQTRLEKYKTSHAPAVSTQ
ncbi:MAG TPA: hypothetical protein VMH27_08870 [Puia sp.]|nr:hypothetical protein [Puia sp.]